MMHKRMGKLALIAKAIPEDQQFFLHGPTDAELTIVGWGSTKGTILDAMKELEERGRKINFLQCRLMRPFPATKVDAILKGAKKLALVEENYSGQLGSLIREQTGVLIETRILKFDGRPFSQDELMEAFEKALAVGGVQEVVTNVG